MALSALHFLPHFSNKTFDNRGSQSLNEFSFLFYSIPLNLEGRLTIFDHTLQMYIGEHNVELLPKQEQFFMKLLGFVYCKFNYMDTKIFWPHLTQDLSFP